MTSTRRFLPCLAIMLLPLAALAHNDEPKEPPEAFDLCEQQTPIRNQGGRDSCTYHPPIAALEAAYRRAGQPVELSVEHLIWLRNTTAQMHSVKDADLNENNLAFLTGGGLSTNFDLLARYGVCTAAEMPYLADHENQKRPYYRGFDVADYRWWEPFRQVSLNRFNLDPGNLPAAARAGGRYGIKDYVFLKGGDCRDPRKIEAAIAAGHEVAVNMFVAYQKGPADESLADMPGLIWRLPKNPAPQPGNSHAMLIVGYDRKRQFFVVKNSWGTNAGGYGAAKLPEDWKDLVRFKGYTLLH